MPITSKRWVDAPDMKKPPKHSAVHNCEDGKVTKKKYSIPLCVVENKLAVKSVNTKIGMKYRSSRC